VAEGNRFPRIHCHVGILTLAMRGTCRVEYLDVIIAVLGLSNGIPPLLIYEGRDQSIPLLRPFEQFVAREAEQDFRVDRVRAYEYLVICERLRRLVDLALAEDRVRARPTGRARQAQEVRRPRTQWKEEGHRAEYAARGELGRLRSGAGRVRRRGDDEVRRRQCCCWCC